MYLCDILPDCAEGPVTWTWINNQPQPASKGYQWIYFIKKNRHFIFQAIFMLSCLNTFSVIFFMWKVFWYYVEGRRLSASDDIITKVGRFSVHVYCCWFANFWVSEWVKTTKYKKHSSFMLIHPYTMYNIYMVHQLNEILYI